MQHRRVWKIRFYAVCKVHSFLLIKNSLIPILHDFSKVFPVETFFTQTNYFIHSEKVKENHIKNSRLSNSGRSEQLEVKKCYKMLFFNIVKKSRKKPRQWNFDFLGVVFGFMQNKIRRLTHKFVYFWQKYTRLIECCRRGRKVTTLKYKRGTLLHSHTKKEYAR